MPKTHVLARHSVTSDRLRQITVDHHDEQHHTGPQRFCREAPCSTLNEFLADWEVR